MIELALALAVIGALLLPLTRTLTQASNSKRDALTQQALTDAKEALLNYAVRQQGCLPLAADYEGGLPDTGISGTATDQDTGRYRADIQRGGDLPWADLGLNNRGMDRRQHRLQYFVASPFTSATANSVTCPARIRTGIESWQNETPYKTADMVKHDGGWYIAATDQEAGSAPPGVGWQAVDAIAGWQADKAYKTGERSLYKDRYYSALEENSGVAPASNPKQWRAIGLPDGSPAPVWQHHATVPYQRGELVTYEGVTYRAQEASVPAKLPPPDGFGWERLSLPERFLETRIGPRIDAPPGNTTVAQQNVFVLIAPARAQNSLTGLNAMRGENHLRCNAPDLCSDWSTMNDAIVDDAVFSLAPVVRDNASDTETIMAVSYAEYQAALARFGHLSNGNAY